MKSVNNKQKGFTVLELLVAIVFLVAVGTIFLIQKRDLEIAKLDTERKIAINSIYYNLEDVYYAAHGNSYPEALTADSLRGVDPSILKDPNGKTVGEQGSDYRYEPKDCKGGNCKSYILTANLDHEADFVKPSRND